MRYDGAPLATDETYYWKVRVWDGNDEASAFSTPAQFTTAFGVGSGTYRFETR